MDCAGADSGSQVVTGVVYDMESVRRSREWAGQSSLTSRAHTHTHAHSTRGNTSSSEHPSRNASRLAQCVASPWRRPPSPPPAGSSAPADPLRSRYRPPRPGSGCSCPSARQLCWSHGRGRGSGRCGCGCGCGFGAQGRHPSSHLSRPFPPPQTAYWFGVHVNDSGAEVARFYGRGTGGNVVIPTPADRSGSVPPTPPDSFGYLGSPDSWAMRVAIHAPQAGACALPSLRRRDAREGPP